MKLNKEELLNSEFGIRLQGCLIAWDMFIDAGNKEAAKIYQAQWELYQLAMKQFLGIEYHFTRTDEYLGACTEDESDWLFKVER